MGMRNVARLLMAALKNSEPFDLISGDVLSILPKADDTGSIAIGSGALDMDVKVFLGASTDFVLLDVGNGQVTFDNAELNLGDNDELEFGDAPDVSVMWNATYLQATSAANPLWTNAPSPLDPAYNTTAYELFDDFFSYDNTATVGGWTLTEVGTGTDAISTAIPGGAVTLTCQVTTDDACEQIFTTR